VPIIEISPESAPEFDRARIGSGFAAEVSITTGDRPFLDYPTALHTRTLSRSRRESCLLRSSH
jgi:hypothetical protein